jgi:hypothetical protein
LGELLQSNKHTGAITSSADWFVVKKGITVYLSGIKNIVVMFYCMRTFSESILMICC